MRKLLAAVCLLATTILYGQTEKPMNNPYVDSRLFHYGFFLGLHTQDMGRLQEAYKPGFSVGVVGELKLSNYWALRITPGFHFGSKDLPLLAPEEPTKRWVEVASNYLTIPIGIKYSARRFNNARPYIMAGVSGSFDVSSNKSKNNEDYVSLKNFNAFAEVAIGCDLYLEYFKLIPELKFSLGLLNSYDKSSLPLYPLDGKPISRLKPNLISLCFYFE